MKRIIFLLAFILVFQIPVFSQETPQSGENKLPNIFIWAIPDDEPEQNIQKDDKKNKNNKNNSNIPVAADTEQEAYEEEPIVLNATTLKGYAEFVEGADDILYMEDYNKMELDLKTPEKIAKEALVDKTGIVPDMKNIYSISKFKGEEYNISPSSRNFTQKDGNWSYGTSFDSEISTSQLENTTSLFTKYDSKYFSLSSKYKKNNMTITQIQTDNFSVIPELKFNNIFAIQDVISTDITRNRRSSELIFSINPLGNKDVDRMRFGIGAKQTYDMNTGNTWSQLNFTTNFKL